MSGEKTEQPTEKKIKDAREKGQVAKSQDLSMALLFLALSFVLVFQLLFKLWPLLAAHNVAYTTWATTEARMILVTFDIESVIEGKFLTRFDSTE